VLIEQSTQEDYLKDENSQHDSAAVGAT